MRPLPSTGVPLAAPMGDPSDVPISVVPSAVGHEVAHAQRRVTSVRWLACRAMAAVTKIILVRHGESNVTVSQVVGGERTCTGLSELGVRQAERLRDRLQ